MLFVLMLSAGCQLGGFSDSKPAAYGEGPVAKEPSALEKAAYALQEKRYRQAEIFAQRALGEEGQNPGNLAAAYRIYSISAASNKHPNAALEALDRWLAIEPQADSTIDWQDTWALAARQLSTVEISLRSEAIFQDSGRNPASRNLALVFMSIEEWRTATDQALGVARLVEQYAGTKALAARKLFEERLLIELEGQAPAFAEPLQGLVTEENQGEFPYAIFAIDMLRRELLIPSKAEEARIALDTLGKQLRIADPLLVNGPHSRKVAVEPSIMPGEFHGTPVVLLLPMGSEASAISEKIIAGARVAQREFAASGQEMSLAVIDTDQPDWASQLGRLPAKAAVVGGPLRTTDYAQAKERGLLASKRFLTFLPRLPEGDEGRFAWRFFPSSEDQVSVLLRFSQDLGITGFGIVHPEEAYGEFMSELFSSKAAAMGIGSIKKTSYAPGNIRSWRLTVGNLLAANANPGMANKATFRAIFLPDTFAAMQTIIPNIFYFGEKGQVLLGTSLWGQDLQKPHGLSEEQIQLAVFPSAWNPENTAPAKNMLDAGLAGMGKGPADFWYALGYDLARFVASMQSSATLDSGAFGYGLHNTHIGWSLAPLGWDSAGLASQQLFLLAPLTTEAVRVNGYYYGPVDEAEFKLRFNSMWK